ncbi:MAG: xanthine dehydrogenase family protein subunit M, partial [Planctomycetota bacterium]
MRVPPFDYFAPRTLAEAAQLLREHPGARLLAG